MTAKSFCDVKANAFICDGIIVNEYIIDDPSGFTESTALQQSEPQSQSTSNRVTVYEISPLSKAKASGCRKRKA